jgi:hypothetical protein
MHYDALGTVVGFLVVWRDGHVSSCEDLGNQLPFHIRQAALDAIVLKAEALEVESEQV